MSSDVLVEEGCGVVEEATQAIAGPVEPEDSELVAIAEDVESKARPLRPTYAEVAAAKPRLHRRRAVGLSAAMAGHLRIPDRPTMLFRPGKRPMPILPEFVPPYLEVAHEGEAPKCRCGRTILFRPTPIQGWPQYWSFKQVICDCGSGSK